MMDEEPPDTLQLSQINKESATLKMQQEMQTLRDEINALKNDVSILQSQKLSPQKLSPTKQYHNVASSTHSKCSSVDSNLKVIDSKQKDIENQENNGSWCGGSCGCGHFTIRYGLNPKVFIASTIVIWGFTFWCLFDENSYDILWNIQTWIIQTFSWLYIGSLCIFPIFMVFLAWHPEYSQIKLGKKNEKPKYNMVSWFSMLFSAGYGIGLYFYGVAEPVMHFRDSHEGCNRYSYLPTQLQAIAGLNLAWFHGGFAALSIYCLVGLTVGYLAHKHDMPMTMRTCFYPLIGDKIYGIAGDIIDILAVVATMFGLCTSLGLGTLQLNAGISLVFGEDAVPNNITTQLIIIWVITGFATISVLSGVDKGIKLISELNFFFGCSLLVYLFFAGDTFFLLNLLVETTGFHIQELPVIFSDTDSFEQAGFDNDSNPRTWMGTWSVFYWSWWIAWSPFVGIFIAEISRGRTVRQFIIGNMMVPSIVTCVWTTIMGGLGLLLELNAMEAGLGDDCYDPDTCLVNYNQDEIGAISDGTYTRISCLEAQNQLFVMIDYYPLPKFISIITIIGVTGYFVTSSDSASYVIDLITTNGEENGPKLQRTFWALTEGATACVVLVAGGSDALYALQTVSIVSALPFCFVLLLMIHSLLTVFRQDVANMHRAQLQPGMSTAAKRIISEDIEEKEKAYQESEGEGDEDYFGEEWHVDFLDAAFNSFEMCLCSFVFPCYLQYKNGAKIKLHNNCRFGWKIVYFVPPVAFVVLLFCGIIDMGFFYIAWTIYVFIAFFGVYQRLKIRAYYKIRGNACCDVFAHLCCYFFAVSQESMQCDYEVLI